MEQTPTVHLTHDADLALTVCGADWDPIPEGVPVRPCPECHRIAMRGPEATDDQATVAGELTAAEELGLLVGAMYGQALAERDQAVAHLRALLPLVPETSWAATNIAREGAAAWLAEYDQTQAVASSQSPEQENP